MILSSPRRQVASAVLNHSAKEQFLPLQAHLYFHNSLNPAVKNTHLQLTTNYYRKPMTKKKTTKFHFTFSSQCQLKKSIIFLQIQLQVLEQLIFVILVEVKNAHSPLPKEKFHIAKLLENRKYTWPTVNSGASNNINHIYNSIS